MTETVDTQELLAGALFRFTDAAAALTRLRFGSDDNHTVVQESVYAEMQQQMFSRTALSRDGVSRSLPPTWVDGIMWFHEVDSTVRRWSALHRTPTPVALDLLSGNRYRPQDAPLLSDRAKLLTTWRLKAVELLAGERKWELVAPCPNCGVATVTRRDSAGDLVRQAALQIGELGCRCQNCRQLWTPPHYRLLAAALGCPTPEGVLTA